MPTIDLGDLKIGAQAALAAIGSVERGLENAREAVQHFGGTARAALDLADQFVSAAAAAEQHQRALMMLGDAWERVRAETNGAISAEQALRVQQELTQSGLRVSGDELASLTRFAREYANNGLLPVDQVLGQLTEALRSGAPDAMRRFGVSVHEGTTRGQAMEQMLRQLHTQQSGLRPQAQTLAESQRDLGRAFVEATDGIINMFTRGGGLSGLLQTLAGNVRDLARELRDPAFLTTAATGTTNHDQARDAATEAATARYGASLGRLRGAASRRGDSALANVELPRAGDISPEQMARLSELADRYAVSAEHAWMAGGESAEEQARYFTHLAQHFREVSAADRAVENSNHAAAATPPPNNAAAGRRTPRDSAPRGGGGGGGNTAAQQADLQRQLEYEQFRELLYGGQAVTAEARTGESRIDRLRREVELNRANADALHENVEARTADDAEQRRHLGLNAEQEAQEARLRQAREDRAKREAQTREQQATDRAKSEGYGSQFGETFANNANLTATSAQRMARTVNGALDSMTGAFKAHFAAVINGKEDVGTALKAMTNEVLTQLAAESVVQALFETARGFAFLASQNYAGAGQAFTSAGIFTAVAVAAGAGAAATAPSQASAGASAGGGNGSAAHAAGGPFASAAGTGGAGGGGNVTYQININGALSTHEQIGDHVRGIINRNAGRGQFTYEERRMRRHASPA